MEETVVTAMETILNATETISSLVSSVFDMITANPLMVVFVAAGLIGTGIGVFKKVKKAAH